MATAESDAQLGDAVGERDRRAAEECMAVVLEAPGMARVYSGAESEYVVDARGPACECGDYTHRAPEGGCKHVRRVKMALGIQDIPEGVQVDPALRAQREVFADAD